jgi:hypothetical protein
MISNHDSHPYSLSWVPMSLGNTHLTNEKCWQDENGYNSIQHSIPISQLSYFMVMQILNVKDVQYYSVSSGSGVKERMCRFESKSLNIFARRFCKI